MHRDELTPAEWLELYMKAEGAWETILATSGVSAGEATAAEAWGAALGVELARRFGMAAVGRYAAADGGLYDLLHTGLVERGRAEPSPAVVEFVAGRMAAFLAERGQQS